MDKRLIVLGGSFNPPTNAHHDLLRTVMDHARGDLGIFVPSSHHYVERKARRSGAPFLFSETERKDMLRAMCDPDMAVSAVEYGDTTNGRTHTTLLELQGRYPDHAVYFIMGDDKLPVLPKWKLSRMLDRFHIIVIERNGNPEAAIDGTPVLKERRDHVHVVRGLFESPVSSTMVRDFYANGQYEKAMRFVHPEVHAMILAHIRKGDR